MKQNIKKYFFPCLLLFLALCLLLRPELLLSLWHKLWGAAVPVVLGIIFAAVIDPAVCTFEKRWAGCSKTVKGQWGAFSFHNPCISADSCGVLGGGVDSHSPPYRQRRPFCRQH